MPTITLTVIEVVQVLLVGFLAGMMFTSFFFPYGTDYSKAPSIKSAKVCKHNWNYVYPWLRKCSMCDRTEHLVEGSGCNESATDFRPTKSDGWHHYPHEVKQ